MSFSQDFIDEVREASDIVDFISQDTQLKPTGGGGAQLMGVCPFPDHNEKTPSFSVSASKQVYHCFGCKKSGNIYSYVTQMRGWSFPEAVEALANKAGIAIPKDEAPRRASDETAQRRRDMVDLNSIAKDFFHKSLLAQRPESPVRKYLAGRGFTEQVIKEFQLGFAPDDWSKLSDAIVSKKRSQELADQVGLLRKRTKSTGYFDLFRNRLMFPIISHKDECVGFGGRVLSKEDQPKYLNSPDSDIFHKGSLFYGLNLAAKYIRSKDKVVIVEGYTDLIALYKAGIECVVATLGTALTPKHARLLKRYTKNVYVLFDGDNAGKSAAERSLPILLAEGLFPKGLTLPEKMDPDEYLNEHGADALKRLLVASPDLFDLILFENLKGFQGHASEKVQLIEKLTPILRSISDKRLLGLYLQSMAARLSVTPEWIWKSISNDKPKEFSQRPTDRQEPESLQELKGEAGPRLIDMKQCSKLEIELINVSLLNERALQMVIDMKVSDLVSSEPAREALKLIEQHYGQAPSKFDTLTAYLQSRVEPGELVAKHMKKPLSEMGVEGAKKLVNDCVKRLKADKLRQKQREFANRLQNHSQENLAEQLEQIMNIHKSRYSLNRENGPGE